MADTLTQLIAKVQTQLKDDGTLFTTATTTAAIRQALAHVNRAVPINAAALITAVADQKEYELSDEDPDAVGITDVLLDGDNDGLHFDRAIGLSFDAYVEDSRWFFRLRSPQAQGETLIVHYIKDYTISGLDTETDSTLPDDLNTAILNAACFYACLVRAAGTVESNNVQQGVAVNWMKLAEHWQAESNSALLAYRRQPTVKGEPTHHTWEDPQHDTSYP